MHVNTEYLAQNNLFREAAEDEVATIPYMGKKHHIESTDDYHQFGWLKTNRPIENSRVQQLMQAISKKNLLHLNPIIVNSDMHVIDGQHRLMAAKKLGIPVFYVRDEEVCQEDIARMNSLKKNWVLKDYINFFVQQGDLDYIAFEAFCKHNPALQPATLLGLVSKDGKAKRSYKDGIIDISNMPLAKLVVEHLRDFSDHTNLAYTSRFVEALSFVVRTGEYDHSHMMKKMEGNPGILQPAASAKGWIENIERIYNRHVREENIVIFLKRR